MPMVSVLIPVRDARPWLEAAFASLWRQRLRDFEVVAVDDGSRDGSGEWLDAESRRESRLRVVHTGPSGLPAALETARAAAAGDWLARHDADDLSHRDRLALQCDHLRHHPEVDVVGCRVRLFPDTGCGVGMRRWSAWHNALMTHEAMACERLIDSPLCHGTAMVRREALARVGGWREAGWAEDLDLWVRMFEAGVRFAKLPRTLYGWRQHPGSSTRTDSRYARERFMDLRRAALDRTLLAGGRRATLLGTGTSLARWSVHLGNRVAGQVEWRGGPVLQAREWPWPLIGVFGAARTRARWRTALTATGGREWDDFAFIA
jgi:glycosyltransferase involved in cell wall biosynthesis